MNNTIRFTKMHGLGNDFVILNNLDRKEHPSPETISKWADRHRGIGFDQLLLLEPSTQADFFCRIFNADGSEAEQCGNGLRCVARFIKEEKLHTDDAFTLQTKSGIYPVSIRDFEHITVIMGAPQIQENLHLQLPAINAISILSIGNPHAIVKVESLDLPNAKELAEKISTHHYFSNGANVGFMQVMNPGHIRLRTFERGVGETTACGSNACAAIVAGIMNGWLNHSVEVEFPYGSLLINWENKLISMTGAAAKVFVGEMDQAAFDLI